MLFRSEEISETHNKINIESNQEYNLVLERVRPEVNGRGRLLFRITAVFIMEYMGEDRSGKQQICMRNFSCCRNCPQPPGLLVTARYLDAPILPTNSMAHGTLLWVGLCNTDGLNLNKSVGDLCRRPIQHIS